MSFNPQPIEIFDSTTSPTNAIWGLGYNWQDLNQMARTSTGISLVSGNPTLTDSSATFQTSGTGLVGAGVLVANFNYIVTANTGSVLTLQRVDGGTGWYPGPYGTTPPAASSYTVTTKWFINASNQLVCSGGYTGTDYELSWAQPGGGGVLNQELWIDFPDLTPMLTGGFTQFDAWLRGGDTLGSAYGTKYNFYLQGASSSTLTLGIQIYQLSNVNVTQTATIGNSSGSESAANVALVGNHWYRLHVYCFWDEISQTTHYKSEFYDINALGAATPLYGGTLMQNYGPGSENTFAPGYNFHLTPISTPGSLCPINGSVCGISANPNGASNPLKIGRLQVRDCVGVDTTASLATQYYQGQHQPVFPGLFAANTRANLSQDASIQRLVTVSEHYAAYDMDSVIVGFHNSITSPDMPNINPVNWLVSVMYPVNSMASAPGDSASLGGPCYPGFVQGGNRVLTLQAGEAGSFAPITIPGRIRAGDKFLIINDQYTAVHAAGGALIYGDAKGDNALYLYSPATLPVPTAPKVRAYYYSGQGTVAAGTYHVITTFKNQGSGETLQGSAETVVSTSITHATGVTYGINSQGYLTITDTSQSLTVNAYPGSQIAVGGNNYTVLENSATVYTLTATAWVGGTPSTGTSYTLTANIISVTSSLQQGAQSFNCYIGTQAPITNSGATVSYGTSGNNVTLTDSSAPFPTSGIGMVGAQFTVTGNTGVYTVLSNTSTVLTAIQTSGASGWLTSQPANTTAYLTNGPYILQNDPNGIAMGRANSTTFQKPFAASGTTPPLTNAAIYDYTIIPIPTGSTPTMSAAGYAVDFCNPTFVGGTAARQSPLVIATIGTSIDAGFQDFGLAITGGYNGQSIGTSSNSSGWVDRAFKRQPGVVSVNLAKSGSPLISDYSDLYHFNQWLTRMNVLQSVNVVVIDHFTNDNASLATLQACYSAMFEMIRPFGVQIWVCTPYTRLTSGYSLPVDIFTTTINQKGLMPGVYGLAPSKRASFVTWLNSLVTAGTINGIIDMGAVMNDPATGVFATITNGSTYVDPLVMTQQTWSTVGGTSTGTSSTTLTDTSKSWATNQWSASGLYVVTSAGSSAIISSNTGSVLTLGAAPDGSSLWTNGTPSPGAAYTIQPVLTPDGTHPAPHGAALMAYQAIQKLPSMQAQLAQSINGPIIASRGRN